MDPHRPWPSDPAGRYLELLKRCLTRYGLGPEYKERRWFGRTLFEPQPPDLALRLEGKDWPRHAETMVGLRRLDDLEHCIRDLARRGIEGDLVETGVWRGGASLFMAACLWALGDARRRLWLADSFEGLPPPEPDTYPADKGWNLHQESYLRATEQEVLDTFQRYGFGMERVHLLKGWFKDTLPQAPIGPIALLRLDGDLYASTIQALEALYGRVAVGGYVVVDDYGAVEPCRKAVEDFRSRHGITAPLVPVDWTGVHWVKDRA